MFLTAAESRCIKSMPKMAHAPELQKNSFWKLVFQVFSIGLVSAAIIAPLGNDSKVAPHTHLFTFALRNQETWQMWP